MPHQESPNGALTLALNQIRSEYQTVGSFEKKGSKKSSIPSLPAFRFLPPPQKRIACSYAARSSAELFFCALNFLLDARFEKLPSSRKHDLRSFTMWFHVVRMAESIQEHEQQWMA